MARKIIPVDDKHVIGTPTGTWIVLWAVREHGPLTIGLLYELVYGYPEHGMSELGFLSRALRELYSLGLVRATDEEVFSPRRFWLSVRGSDDEIDYRHVIVEVTPAVALMQNRLGISITEYASGKPQWLTIEPLFGRPRTWRRKAWPDVFVLMPFVRKLWTIYEEHICAVVKKLDLSCQRGDDFFSTDSVVEEIWTAIFNSRICIADCTGRNANVFYELGIAHTISKPTILISQSLDDVPFDIRHRRFILYQHTRKGLREFETQLVSILRQELELPPEREE